MWPYNFHPASSGYNQTEGHLTSPAQFSPYQDHASTSEQSIAAEDQGTNPYHWITLPYLSPHRAPVDIRYGVTETLSPAITLQSPTPDSCPLQQGRSMQPYPHCSAGGYPPFSQHAMQVTPGEVDNDVIGHYGLPPRVSPPAHNGQTEGTQGVPDFCSVFSPYPAVVRSPPLDNGAQVEQVVAAGGTGSLGDTTPLGSRPPFGTGNEETPRPSVGLPQSGTNNAKTMNPKKRKFKATTQDEPSKVKRTKYSTRRLLNLPGGDIQPTPLSLPSRPELRPVPQVEYKDRKPRGKWVKLPDIDFRVKGKDGINLIDAKNERFDGPDDRDDLMFMDGNVGSSISCRMIFEGYQASGNTRQIVTTNHKNERSRITRKRLAQDVARHVEAYLEELKAAGTPYPVQLEDIFLTKLTHVSRASWQPQIWCRATPSNSTSA